VGSFDSLVRENGRNRLREKRPSAAAKIPAINRKEKGIIMLS